MIFKNKTTIRENLIETLKAGPMKTFDLVKTVMKKTSSTKQGVYKMVRTLKAEGVITITKGITSLNDMWIDHLLEYAQQTKQSYRQSFNEQYLNLENGESVSYYFNSFKKADIFWSHLFSQCVEVLPSGEGIYTYIPHEWFSLSSQLSSEQALINKSKKVSVPYYATVGHNFYLDKVARKKFDLPVSMQYCNLETPLFQNQRYYFNIFGDILIEVWVSKHVADELHNVFTNTKEYSEHTAQKIESIVASRGKVRLKISKDKRKASKLKKRLQKNFWIQNKN